MVGCHLTTEIVCSRRPLGHHICVGNNSKIVRISIVIPVINEKANIGQAIERAWNCGADEVIVVDGGSSDGTLDIIESANCKRIQANAGRGQQQNAGAEAATGDVIIFLHADIWLEGRACEQIREQYAHNSQLCGAFCQTIESPRRIYRWIESGNSLRVRWRGLFYGDQGIFVSRSLLKSVGGFENVPLMEDIILAQKLRKFPRVLLPGPIHVDARRWQENGPVRQTVRNWVIVGLYYLGVHPKTLSKLYKRHDKS